MITAPGIFTDIRPDDYLADPCPEPSVTQSIVKTLLEHSPAHARAEHPRLALPLPAAVENETTEKYNKAQAIGDAVHGMLLGRGKTLAVGQFDSWRGKDPQKFKDVAIAEGKTLILEKHWNVANAMYGEACRQLRERGLHASFVDFGGSEVVLAWQEGGAWCRTMIDRLSEDRRHVLDFKSTAMNASPHAVGALMANAGWPIQAAMHERGLNALDPDNAGRRRHTFILQEQYPPYALAAYDMREAVMHMGRKRLELGLCSWFECMRTGVWPAYPIETQYPELPGWVEQRWLEREETETVTQPIDNVLIAG